MSIALRVVLGIVVVGLFAGAVLKMLTGVVLVLIGLVVGAVGWFLVAPNR